LLTLIILTFNLVYLNRKEEQLPPSWHSTRLSNNHYNHLTVWWISDLIHSFTPCHCERVSQKMSQKIRHCYNCQML